MADSETPRGNETGSEEVPRKRRKHGYRGYPNSSATGGDVHTGSGFGGAGSLSRSGNPIDSRVISERTRDDAKED